MCIACVFYSFALRLPRSPILYTLLTAFSSHLVQEQNSFSKSIVETRVLRNHAPLLPSQTTAALQKKKTQTIVAGSCFFFFFSDLGGIKCVASIERTRIAALFVNISFWLSVLSNAVYLAWQYAYPFLYPGLVENLSYYSEPIAVS